MVRKEGQRCLGKQGRESVGEVEVFVGGVVGVCGEADQSLISRRVGHDGDLDGVVGKEALLKRIDRVGW